MDRVEIAQDLSFSRLVYGMWRIGDDEDVSTRHVRAKLDACLEQGITTIDQADIYGGYTAERILGDALREAPDLRDGIEIITKCDIVAPAGRHAAARVKHYDTSRGHIESAVEHSLRDLGTDRIDLLLIHRPDPLMDPAETGRTLDDLVRSGKVRAVGVSNFRPWHWSLLQSAMDAPLRTNQIELSLSAHTAFTDGDVAFLQEKGLPIMAWSPLGGGALVGTHASDRDALRKTLTRLADENGVDVAAVAVAWLLAHPARILPILGTNNLERIARISEAARVAMDRQTWFELYTAALGHEVP